MRTSGCLLVGRIRILVLTLQSIIFFHWHYIILIAFLREVVGPVKDKWIIFHNNIFNWSFSYIK